MSALDRYREPSHRPLRVYAFDPSAGRRLNNAMTISVPYEKLEPGPVGKRIAVIDYDASSERFYEPVDLDHPSVLIGNGLAPSESDPRFHQQMVYAIACNTMQHFERALGRAVRWRRPPPGSRTSNPFHTRLRIFPHAFQQANAYYDARLRAVLFGYFAASGKNPGEALPGQTVFTCLSHDIVAHEITHATIDGQREFLTDATSPDAAAFHEAFADIVALFQHFTYKEALLDTIYRTGGLIYRRQLDAHVPRSGESATVIPELTEENPLVQLARQFGQARGEGSALRSAIGTPPSAADLATTLEPHARGAILVSAVFDAFFTAYVQQTSDLMRIARAGGSISPQGDLHPDLANRLADEASKIAGHFVTMCIRALDYCPPIDLKLGEFLRAIVTADADLVPDDSRGYRTALIKAFRLRGIVPEEVRSYSEESLAWCTPEQTGKGELAPCEGLQFNLLPDDREPLARQRERAEANAKALNAFARAYPEALGLDPKRQARAHSFHPVHRVSPTGKLVVDFVVELLQQRDEPVNPSLPNSPLYKFRGGSTVIFDHRGNVRYVIEKSIHNRRRQAQQRAFHLAQLQAAPAAAYVSPTTLPPQVNFQLVHRGG